MNDTRRFFFSSIGSGCVGITLMPEVLKANDEIEIPFKVVNPNYYNLNSLLIPWNEKNYRFDFSNEFNDDMKTIHGFTCLEFVQLMFKEQTNKSIKIVHKDIDKIKIDGNFMFMVYKYNLKNNLLAFQINGNVGTSKFPVDGVTIWSKALKTQRNPYAST